jgi:hypothetical protein
MTARSTFIRDIQDIVEFKVIQYFKASSNRGRNWASLMLCPDSACSILEVKKVAREDCKAYWEAVAKYVRFALVQDVLEDEYDSDDEIDMVFLASTTATTDEDDE